VLHEPRVVITNFIADDVPKELRRLEAAVETMRSDLDLLLERGEAVDGGEHREVLEAYRMFAYDRGWVHRLEEAVATGLTAEAAVERVQSDTRARMLRATDPYLRERLHDLDELANRLMHQLVGKDYAPARDRLPENAVLVARSMGPAALLDYDRKRLRGLVLEEGGPHSHVAIVARALGIPAVGRIDNATGVVDPGDPIIVDGSAGDVHVRPTPEMERAYVERVRLRARRQSQYQALRDKPCITTDNEKIALLINAGLAVDLPHVQEAGAAGIGLFRTELQFMVAASFPRSAEQFSLYRAVLDAAGEKPVTFRTLDIGGDKVLPFMRNFEEENPALGWRAIRLGLDRPGLLRSQIRALLRAAGGRDLHVMFPMIATIEEFDEAKSLVERELTHLRRHGHKLPEHVEVGSMVEVPSLLYQLDELLARVDFLSVGTNDLVQFFYAADRGNVRVADRFDSISAPVLRALRVIADKSREHGKPVTVCGEIASQPLGALALVGIGYRSLSLTPSSIGPVKAMLLGVHAGKTADFIVPLIERPAGTVSIRQQLTKFAEQEGLQI
jgi:phosphotransferase system enzyme I (PtsP)